METTTVKTETAIPIERLRYYCDEKLCFCLNRKIHSVRCPKNPQIPIEIISAQECNACSEESK